MSQISVCTQCGSVVNPNKHRASEFGRGFLMGAGQAPAWTWAFMRKQQPTCPECGAAALVPTHTPAGRRILEETGQSAEVELVSAAPKAQASQSISLPVLFLMLAPTLLLAWRILAAILQ